MFRNLTIRSKLLIIVAAVVGLFLTTTVGLSVIARKHVVQSVQMELERSRQITSAFYDARYKQLDAGLRSLVDSPEIRAVLTTKGIDHDTQLMSIIDLQHMLGADAILYCNPEGRTLARTDDPFDEESIVTDINIIASALKGDVSRGVWNLEDEALLAIAFPVILDEEVRGVVCAGVSTLDDAESLSSLLLRDVVVSREGTALTSTLEEEYAESLPELQQDVMIASIQDVDRLPIVQLPASDESDETAQSEPALVATIATQVAPAETFNASVFIPEQAVYGFYHEFKAVLLWLGIVAVSVCLLITLRIGAIISSQVRQTEQTLQSVAAGDLTAHLDMETKDEFGRIAKSLNTAIQASAATLDTLAERNRDTKMLLDAVEEGFFTVDSTGQMSDERSGAVDRMFGAPQPGMKFSDFIAQFDESAASWIDLGWEDVFTGMMPVEVTLDQLPKRFEHNDRVYSIEYTPVNVDGQLNSVAVVLSDITATVENEKLEAEQREVMEMVHRVAEDRTGFMEFINESNDLVTALREQPRDDIDLTKRRIHTLKGNTSIYGLKRVSELCHIVEDYIAENNELPPEHTWNDAFEAWDSVIDRMHQVCGESNPGVVIAEQDFDDLLQDVLKKVPHDDLAIRLTSYKLEPTSIRLHRISEQIGGLAERLGKPQPEVVCEDNGLRLDAANWSEFWSAFIHVVRNSVDHGLEPADARVSAGKPESGCIKVCSAIVGDEFELSIADDGCGINWDRVMEAAYKKGLPGETQEDLVNALFADGVSTAERVTDTSGRGVGMAAIKEVCNSLGGCIKVDSEPGKGTCFRFRFPLNQMAPETVSKLSEYCDADCRAVVGLDQEATPTKAVEPQVVVNA